MPAKGLRKKTSHFHIPVSSHLWLQPNICLMIHNPNHGAAWFLVLDLPHDGKQSEAVFLCVSYNGRRWIQILIRFYF
jgi:hypothetical protein